MRTTSIVCNWGHPIAQDQRFSQVAASRTHMFNSARSRHPHFDIPVQHTPLFRAALVEAHANAYTPSSSA